jgi:cobalt-zinc-cadmium efflux system membrane fusion protein
MNLRRPGAFKPIFLSVIGIAVAGAIAAGVLFGLPLLREWTQPAKAEEKPAGPVEPGVSLVQGETVEVLKKVLDKLKIKTGPVTEAKPRLLELRGSTTFDLQELARIKSRFPGEVDRIEDVRDPLASGEKGESVMRSLRPGDFVKQGARLAVVWSKDLGEKKSELVNALSQLYLDQATLKNLEKAADVIPEQRMREQRQQVESDLIAVDRARRTLESWRLTDPEIKEIEDEALRIRERRGERDSQKRKDWPRVDIVSPIDGVIVEKNVVRGDFVNDITMDLFKVANLDHLAVWVHAYEEDLPALQAYEKQKQEQGQAVPWKISLRDDAGFTPVQGKMTRIGLVVDPVQHTVIVDGTVDNKDHRLRIGEKVVATVALPPAKGEVSIPIGALVEDGKESIVFVATSQGQFTMKRVHVTRRGLEEAQVKEGPIEKGDSVVTSGAIELKAALDDLKGKAQEQK